MEELRKALEAEQLKNKQLEEKLKMKSFENDMIKRQVHLIPSFSNKLPLTRKDQEALLISLEREEEYINNMLHQSLQRLVQEKIEIENAIEQEQEFIVNTMSRQLAKALSDKFQYKQQFSSPRTELGPFDAEEIVTDSSFSSDSENGRDMRGKQQVRLLENNLTSIKQQIKIARSEIKKCKNYEDKEMYLKLKNANDLMGKETKNMSEGEDTDRSSEFSCGSLSSRSIGLDTSLDSNVASRENSSTPKPRINKM